MDVFANKIAQECTAIKQQSASFSSIQWKTSFDRIADNFKEDNIIRNNSATIQNVVSTLADTIRDNRLFYQTRLLDHRLFIFIRDYYLALLRQWRTDQVLDSISSQVFTQIAALFADLCLYASATDLDQLRPLLVHQPFIKEIDDCLQEIATHGRHLHDERIRAIDYILRAIHYFQKGRSDIQNLPMFFELIDGVTHCVCSKYFIETFIQLENVEHFNETQTFLLDTCTDYISWHDGNHYNDTCTAIRTAILPSFNVWFGNQELSFYKLNRIAIRIIGQLCITLIGGNASDEEVFPEPARSGYCTMIDKFSSLLYKIIESDITADKTKDLARVLAQNLYSLTMTNDLRTYIKNKGLCPLLLKVAAIDDETVQFHVYRILASIMTEADLKTLKNSDNIVNVFLKFLMNLIDDTSRVPRFHNLLRSLTVLVQHDQIKQQLVQQGALVYLLRCATESKFDPIKAQIPALEILLSLTFNDEAKRQLSNNAQFISYLKTVFESSTESRLQRVAESLLWTFNNEERIKVKANQPSIINTLATKKYDIMLSYSHSDKELCCRIYDSLVKDNFQVWIDCYEMHGSAMLAMANAVENSNFVFLCMSEAYKQSVYCQSEAHYAFERRCFLIPLVMKPGYRPDGWLGIIASGKIYVDFPKLGFDTAYDKLKKEIYRYRENSSDVASSEKPIEHTMDVDVPYSSVTLTLHQLPLVTNYPTCIDQWTTNDVRSFLVNEKLDALLPVVGNMNGHLLYETHKRCKEHWGLMFQAFKDEVTASNTQQNVLSVETYIRFLDTIEKYVPINSEDHQTKKFSRNSPICTLL